MNRSWRSFPNIAGITLIVLGVIGIFLGLSKGEENVVLQKAIRICMECIGLG